MTLAEVSTVPIGNSYPSVVVTVEIPYTDFKYKHYNKLQKCSHSPSRQGDDMLMSSLMTLLVIEILCM